MEIKTLGIDIAKRVFQLHGVDAKGKIVKKKKIKPRSITRLYGVLSGNSQKVT